MKQPERPKQMFQQRSRAGAAFLCTACALFLSWGYRHFFDDRHTSGMPLAEALAGLRSGQLGERERDLALRIVRDEALALVRIIQADAGTFAGTALDSIREASQR